MGTPQTGITGAEFATVGTLPPSAALPSANPDSGATLPALKASVWPTNQGSNVIMIEPVVPAAIDLYDFRRWFTAGSYIYLADIPSLFRIETVWQQSAQVILMTFDNGNGAPAQNDPAYQNLTDIQVLNNPTAYSMTVVTGPVLINSVSFPAGMRYSEPLFEGMDCKAVHYDATGGSIIISLETRP